MLVSGVLLGMDVAVDVAVAGVSVIVTTVGNAVAVDVAGKSVALAVGMGVDVVVSAGTGVGVAVASVVFDVAVGDSTGTNAVGTTVGRLVGDTNTGGVAVSLAGVGVACGVLWLPGSCVDFGGWVGCGDCVGRGGVVGCGERVGIGVFGGRCAQSTSGAPGFVINVAHSINAPAVKKSEGFIAK